MNKYQGKPSVATAREKIFRYCAYQERSHAEVKNKLYDYGLSTDDVETLTTQLITDGFLNEERFARAFAGGKFRIKGWGRIKITHELEARGITKNCIQSGLKEIDEKDYLRSLENLLNKKASQVDNDDAFVMRDKLAKYAIQKGYEPDLVWTIVKAMSK